MTEPRPTREHLYEIIFEADTRAGRAFDLAVLLLIVSSIVTVMLESVPRLRARYGTWFDTIEWTLTVLFTLEYLARLSCVRRPLRYAWSLFGVIDLLAILPSYLSLFASGTESLVVIRALRLLRVFRVFKLARFLSEADVLLRALRASVPKMTVFLITVLIIITIVGTAMYLVEGAENPGFANIPQSVYWAIVTVTTVGFGDSVPLTTTGKLLASLMMITGFGILAVPSGIMAAEIFQQRGPRQPTTQVCPECLAEGHDHDAAFCKLCGGKLN